MMKKYINKKKIELLIILVLIIIFFFSGILMGIKISFNHNEFARKIYNITERNDFE